MKKAIMWVLSFLYRVTGLKSLVDAIDNRVFIYKRRLNIVPSSFKVFVWVLGVLTGASGVYIHENHSILENEPVIYENSIPVLPTAKASETPPEVKNDPISDTPQAVSRTVEELADYIWMKESSRGVNNFSKCEAIGKINGIGYRIPGNGSYTCFESHEDEMTVLMGWIIDKKSLGWDELKMLCTYSGQNYAECK